MHGHVCMNIHNHTHMGSTSCQHKPYAWSMHCVNKNLILHGTRNTCGLETVCTLPSRVGLCRSQATQLAIFIFNSQLNVSAKKDTKSSPLTCVHLHTLL